LATRANTLNPSTLTVRENSVVVPGSRANNDEWATVAVEVSCQAGETAIGIGTRWDPEAEEEEVFVTDAYYLTDGNGKPVGAHARGASDEAVDRTFIVSALCAAPQ
jgi:hypothetical protein